MKNYLDLRLPIANDDNFRRIKTAHDNKGIKYYIANINARAFAENGKDLLANGKKDENWKRINPRESRESTDAWKSMWDSLENDAENFFYKNKGILILAKDVQYEHKNKSIKVELTNRQLHGLADGGHTLDLLIKYFEENPEVDDAFIKIEFIVGFDVADQVTRIVEARNTALQVKEDSIMNLKGFFDPIKKVIQEECVCADRVSYKEYEKDNEGRKKDISIKEILGFLVAFDVEVFTADEPPTIAYSSKKKVLDHYKERHEDMTKLYVKELPKILELWDTVYKSMPDLYLGNIMSLKKGDPPKSIVKDYAKKNKEVELRFLGEETRFKIPDGWVYPIFAAFRELIEIRNGVANFTQDPVIFFEENKKSLGKIFMNVLDGNNNDPQTIGKSKSVWSLFALKVQGLMEKSR